jgi:hypothetical protein
MKTLIAFSAAAFLLLFPVLFPQLAIAVQEMSSPAEADSSDVGGFLLHIQMGIWYLISGDQERRMDESDDPPFLWTWDVAGLRWDKKHSSWGLGIRVAAGYLGFRAGAKGLYRIPIGARKGAYLQLAGGMYVLTGDGDLVDTFPGPFLEMELAANKKWGLVLGVESLKYLVSDPGWAYETPSWREKRSTFVFGGIKAGQWGAIALTAALFGLAAIVASGW